MCTNGSITSKEVILFSVLFNFSAFEGRQRGGRVGITLQSGFFYSTGVEIIISGECIHLLKSQKITSAALGCAVDATFTPHLLGARVCSVYCLHPCRYRVCDVLEVEVCPPASAITQKQRHHSHPYSTGRFRATYEDLKDCRAHEQNRYRSRRKLVQGRLGTDRGTNHPNIIRAFGINADQWTTAAQDEEELCKTAEQGVGRSMAKWTAAKKVRAVLRHVIGCPNVTRRVKERIA